MEEHKLNQTASTAGTPVVCVVRADIIALSSGGKIAFATAAPALVCDLAEWRAEPGSTGICCPVLKLEDHKYTDIGIIPGCTKAEMEAIAASATHAGHKAGILG